jgi:hypothetical protein
MIKSSVAESVTERECVVEADAERENEDICDEVSVNDVDGDITKSSEAERVMEDDSVEADLDPRVCDSEIDIDAACVSVTEILADALTVAKFVLVDVSLAE